MLGRSNSLRQQGIITAVAQSTNVTMWAFIVAAFVPLLVHGQVSNPTEVLTANNDSMKFVILGTFGRVGACSALYNYDQSYCIGSFEQLGTASWINQICGIEGPCDAIITPGHCFYPQGAHATDNPSRFITDWRNVYQLATTPNIANLPWYITLGDHDQNGDIEEYLNYNNVDVRWNFPSRYYSQDFSSPSANVTVRLIVLDDQPWLSNNVAQPGQTYSNTSNNANPEFQFQNQPAQVNAQLAFLENAINSSKADYIIISQHQPIFGTTDGYGYQDAQQNASSPFNREIAILNKYNVTAVFTGDDYVVHYGRALNITLSHQINVGSVSEADCHDGIYTATYPYQVPWVSYVNSNCSTGESNLGFAFVTATKENLTINLYSSTYYQAEPPNYYYVPNFMPNYTVVIPPGQLNGSGVISAGAPSN